MARQMVINFGMSDIGPWSLMDPSAQQGDMIMRMMSRNSMSENLQQKIDGAVKKISEQGYEMALQQIRDNRCGEVAARAGGYGGEGVLPCQPPASWPGGLLATLSGLVSIVAAERLCCSGQDCRLTPLLAPPPCLPAGRPWT